VGTWGSFPRIKQPVCEADHSHPSSAEVKDAWSYTFTSPYIFMVWYLVKHRDSFTLILGLGLWRGGISVFQIPCWYFSPSYSLGLSVCHPKNALSGDLCLIIL